jgi:predicted nucleotidyltransferase
VPPTPEIFDELLDALTAACRSVYGSRLVALAVFGSVGRGTALPDSDVDLLIVATDLSERRIGRVEEFAAVEALLEPRLAQARHAGVDTRLSPVFRTPDELEVGGPLLLDLVDDARLLVDTGPLARRLARLKRRLEELGSRRIWLGNAWYWDLKPDYRPGEVFEL